MLIRPLSTILAALSLLAPLLAEASPQTAAAPPEERGVRKRNLNEERPRWVEGQVLVRFEDDVRRSEAKEVHRALGAQVEERIKPFDVEVVDLPPDVSVPEALAAYEADPAVAEASPNLIRHISIVEDPRLQDQWAHQNTGQLHPVPEFCLSTCSTMTQGSGSAGSDGRTADAWVSEDGVSDTVIAILDNGVDTSHPDLVDRLWRNQEEYLGAAGLDDDGHGYDDDIHGCDFTDDDCTVLVDAPTPHGSHVAGIAAAERGNSYGVSGVCPGCRIMVLKVGAGNNIFLDAELKALAYLTAIKGDPLYQDVRFIVNASFGSGDWVGPERRAIKLLGDAGILFVAAAGNDALDNDMALSGFGGFSPSFPASYDLPNILAVAASNHRDQYGYPTGCQASKPQGLGLPRHRCLFTNWGRRSVDLAAPGVDILSSVPGADFDTWDGTSMAAPFAAGVAGLVWSKHTGFSAIEVKNAILNSVDHPANMDSLPFEGRTRRGKFTQTADGRINASQALVGDPDGGPGIHDGTIQGAKKIKRLVKGRVAWPNDVNDVYKKRLKPGRYRIVLRGGSDKDFDLYLWKPGTTEIWQFEESCFIRRGACKLLRQKTSDNANEKFRRLRIRDGGLYYIHVTAYLFESGPYRLRVKRLS